MKKFLFTSFIKLINCKDLVAIMNAATDSSKSLCYRRRAVKKLPKVNWSVNSELRLWNGNYMPSCLFVFTAKVPDGISPKEFFEKYIKPHVHEDNIVFVFPDPLDDNIIYIGKKFKDYISENWEISIPLVTPIGVISALAVKYGEPTILPPLKAFYYINLKAIKNIIDVEDIMYSYDRTKKVIGV